MNYTTGAVTNNEVTVAIGTDNKIDIYSTANTDVVVDVMGYYTAQTGPPPSTYTYNGDGLRTSTTISGNTSQFTYDINTAIPTVLGDGTWYFVYGPTGPAGQQLPLEEINIATGAVYDLHHDNIGSTIAIAITNTSGTTVNTLTYDPYGNLNAQTGTTTTPLTYTGAYQDTTTGLTYLLHRYYDPTTAQYLTIDPLLTQTDQPYTYANDNPLNHTDPSGECGLPLACILSQLNPVPLGGTEPLFEASALAIGFGAVAIESGVAAGATGFGLIIGIPVILVGLAILAEGIYATAEICNGGT